MLGKPNHSCSTCACWVGGIQNVSLIGNAFGLVKANSKTRTSFKILYWYHNRALEPRGIDEVNRYLT
jgi:hypothetical protein